MKKKSYYRMSNAEFYAILDSIDPKCSELFIEEIKLLKKNHYIWYSPLSSILHRKKNLSEILTTALIFYWTDDAKYWHNINRQLKVVENGTS